MRLLALATFAALALAGCRQQSIVGTWKQTGMVTRSLTFTEDGNFIATGDGVAAAVSLESSYSVDKNRFKLTGLKAKSNIPFVPMGEHEMPGGEEISGTFSFKNSDTLTIQGTMVFDGSYTRVKE